MNTEEKFSFGSLMLGLGGGIFAGTLIGILEPGAAITSFVTAATFLGLGFYNMLTAWSSIKEKK